MPDVDSPNLDDVNKTVFCIPYKPREDIEARSKLPDSVSADRDLENGKDLRFLAYQEAWKACLNRMQEIIRELQNPFVEAVVHEVRSSYTNVLPGLPYPELPVVAVINPGLGSTFLDNIASQLETEESIESQQSVECIVTHLHPGDFTSVSAGMRAIVTGFVEREGVQDGVKRKVSSSLASYDIKYLLAWFRTRLKASELDSPPNLVVVLHDFEQLDTQVMQDIFDICSGSISVLPLVFLISMSSSSSNFLNVNYPVATMALLRVRYFVVPSGSSVLQEVVLRTFFDTHFEPLIMIGPSVLEYLQEYFMRFHSSVDAILTILQIAHMRHFISEPLAALVRVTPSTDILSKPGSSGFLKSLSARLSHLDGGPNVDMDSDESHPLSNISLIIDNVNLLRRKFYTHLRSLRLGFRVMTCIQSLLEDWGYKGLDWSTDAKKGGLYDAIIRLLKGHLTRDVKELVRYTSKLKQDELRGLLDRLHEVFFDLPPYSHTEEHTSILAQLAQMKNSLGDSNVSAKVHANVSATLSGWVAQYLGDMLKVPEECDLWDVWYTGLTPFPSELLNPSVRASLMAGLLRPHDYVDDINGSTEIEPVPKEIWELPDTSILFKRYLDSGKMINVYDWFESFKNVLDSQRAQLKERASPRKRERSKKKSQALEAAGDDDKWNLEAQARFIRALHELDYLGFIKHTNRKADHLLRTIFDVDDAD